MSDTSSELMSRDTPVFTVYTRVTNPQAIGLSVESFAANSFTAANVVVVGLRRASATASSPAFQTNRFVGNINAIAPSGTPSWISSANPSTFPQAATGTGTACISGIPT